MSGDTLRRPWVSAPLADPERFRTPVRRLDAVFGGPVWWAMHLGITYWLVPRSCRLGVEWPLHTATVVLVLLCARAALSGLQLVRAGRASGDGRSERRDVYLGWLGIALGSFFGAVTLAEGMPAFFIGPCL